MSAIKSIGAVSLGLLLAAGCASSNKEEPTDAAQRAQEVATSGPEETGAAGPANELGIWADESFRRDFMGSYGMHSELEPPLDATERETLQEIFELMRGGQEDQAIARLEEVTTPDTSAQFDFLLGNLYYQEKGDVAQAAKHYRQAVLKFPNFRRAHKLLGTIRSKQGRFDDAIRSLSRVIQFGGGDGLTYGLLGFGYGQTGQWVSAESAYRSAVLLDPETMDWQFGLLQSLAKQEKWAEVVELTGRLIEQNPDRTDLWRLQANAYIGLDKPLEAAFNYETLRRMDEATARSQATLGDIYVNEGMWDLARKAYAHALELGEDISVDRALSWVERLAQRGAYEQARSLIDAVEERYEGEIGTGSRKRLLRLAARLAVAQGEGGEAAEVLEEVVSLDPLDGQALIMLGQHYAQAGEPEKAQLYLERAGNLDDFEAEAKLRHGQLLVQEGRYQDAVPLLERSLELDSRPEVELYLEQVRRLARRSS